MNAVGADTSRESRIGRHQQHETPLPADAGQSRADGEAILRAEVAIDDAETRWQVGRDLFGMARALWIGHEPGAGQGAAIAGAGRLRKPRGREKLAADRSLRSWVSHE